MTEKLRQSLSAAIDDEADAFELRRVLDELGRDDALRSLWDRYHLIGSVLRGERQPVPPALRDRVWAALQGDTVGDGVPEPLPDPARPAAPAQPGVASPVSSRAGRLTGLAVAASVAFAVVIGMSGLWSGGTSTGGTELAVRDSGPVSADSAAGITGGAPTTADDRDSMLPGADVSPSDVQRAQAYILHHTQQQAINQAGVLPFVKLATYEAP